MLVKYDTIKHFVALGSILYFYPKKGEKHAFLFKIGLTYCYLDVISRYSSNRLSPIVIKISLKNKSY